MVGSGGMVTMVGVVIDRFSLIQFQNDVCEEAMSTTRTYVYNVL